MKIWFLFLWFFVFSSVNIYRHTYTLWRILFRSNYFFFPFCSYFVWFSIKNTFTYLYSFCPVWRKSVCVCVQNLIIPLLDFSSISLLLLLFVHSLFYLLRTGCVWDWGIFFLYFVKIFCRHFYNRDRALHISVVWKILLFVKSKVTTLFFSSLFSRIHKHKHTRSLNIYLDAIMRRICDALE